MCIRDSYLAMYFITFLRNGILTNLREDVYKKIVSMPISFFTEKKKGDVISRITADVLEIQGLISFGEITSTSFILISNSFVFISSSLISKVIL